VIERPGTIPDDLPRRGLFTEPVRVERLELLLIEDADQDQVRVSFRCTVKDADDRRCPALAVEARVAGPERTAGGLGNADLFGQVTFRMTGPRGTYRCEIIDVAAGGLDFDRDGSELALDVTA
jgi:hypothetical protein